MATTSSISVVLQEAISRLVNGLGAEQIYLFGSQATGQSGKDSDYDLLVVVPPTDLPRHRREALSYDLLWGFTTPIDVVVFTRDEFQRQSQVKTSLATTAKSHGVLLYEKPKN